MKTNNHLTIWKRVSIFIWILFLFTGALDLYSKSISPIQYGLLNARNGEDRYRVLYRVHVDALKNQWSVDYSGINVIDITIPKDAASIPLGNQTDFQGVVFNVLNRNKDIFLFSIVNSSKSVDLNPNVLDSKSVSGALKSRRKRYLLSVEDQNKWTDRVGYSEVVKRKDILLIKKGKIKGDAISGYNSFGSKPKFEVIEVSEEEKYIRNIVFNRNPDSSKKTYLVDAQNQYNLKIQNVTINTPKSSLTADRAISLRNCLNIKVSNVTINGTYSQSDAYGYGIYLNNIRDILFEGLSASGNWGVFGSYSVVNAKLRKCKINRFDVHCYARDIVFEDCTIHDLYNQFSSLYGSLVFQRCRFDKAIPVLLESSYNAYTPFQIIMEDCTMNIDASHDCLVSAGRLDLGINQRSELRDRTWPSITVKNLSVIVPRGIKEFYLYKVRDFGKKSVSIDGVCNIDIKGLNFILEDSNDKVKFVLCNKSVVLKNLRSCEIESNLSKKNIINNLR